MITDGHNSENSRPLACPDTWQSCPCRVADPLPLPLPLRAGSPRFSASHTHPCVCMCAHVHACAHVSTSLRRDGKFRLSAASSIPIHELIFRVTEFAASCHDVVFELSNPKLLFELPHPKLFFRQPHPKLCCSCHTQNSRAAVSKKYC